MKENNNEYSHISSDGKVLTTMKKDQSKHIQFHKLPDGKIGIKEYVYGTWVNRWVLCKPNVKSLKMFLKK